MQWHRPFQAVPVTVSFAVLTPRWTTGERLHFAVFSGPREVTTVRTDSQSDGPEHVYYSATYHGRMGYRLSASGRIQKRSVKNFPILSLVEM